MIKEALDKVREEIPEGVTLVAVSKTKPVASIQEAIIKDSAYSEKIAFRNWPRNMSNYLRISNGT